MREEIAGVLAFKFDYPRVKLVEALVRPFRPGRDAIALVKRPCHVQIHVHVDSALLELGDEIVHPLLPRRVKFTLCLWIERKDALCLRRLGRPAFAEEAVFVVEKMEAYAVDAETHQTRGEAIRLFVRREVGGTREVRSVEAHASPVVHETPILYADTPVLSGGSLHEMAHVHHVVRRIVRRQERKHPFRRGERKRRRSEAATADTCNQLPFLSGHCLS